jgi:hypothetical protein
MSQQTNEVEITPFGDVNYEKITNTFKNTKYNNFFQTVDEVYKKDSYFGDIFEKIKEMPKPDGGRIPSVIRRTNDRIKE